MRRLAAHAKQASAPSEAGLIWTFQTGDWHDKSDPDFSGKPVLIVESEHIIGFDVDTGNYKWHVNIGPNATALITNGKVFVDDGSRLNESDGNPVWDLSVPHRLSSFASIGETLFFGTRDGRCHAVDMESGESIWQTSLTIGNIDSEPRPIANEDTVFFRIEENVLYELDSIYALDAATGSELWSIPGERDQNLLLADSRTLLVSGWDNEWYLLGLNAATGDVRWRRTTGNSSAGTPTLLDGTVYLLDTSNNLNHYVALDLLSGELKWQLPAETQVWTTPVLHNNSVFVGNGHGKMYALDAGTGMEYWQFNTNDVITSDPLIMDAVLYFGGSNGYAYSLEPSSGEERWKVNTGRSGRPAPDATSNVLLWKCGGGKIMRLDPASGSEHWRFATQSAIWTSPVAMNESVYVGSDDGNIYAMNLETGAESWRFQTNGAVDTQLSLEDEVLYGGSDDGNLYAVNSVNGDVIWNYFTDETIDTAPTLARGNVVFGSGKNLYSLDANSGSENWRFYTEGSLLHAPWVLDSTVFATGYSGLLYAVGGREGSGFWGFFLDGFAYLEPAITDDAVYVATDDGILFSISTMSGLENWRFKPEFGVSTPPVVHNSTLYIGVAWEGLYAIDAPTGAVIWRCLTDASISSGALTSPALVVGDTVIVGGIGSIYGVDTSSGFLKWTFKPYSVISSPGLVHEGTVYFVSEGGTLFALDPKTGTSHWQYDLPAPVASAPIVNGDTIVVGSLDGAVHAFQAVPPPVEPGIAAEIIEDSEIHERADAASDVVAEVDRGTEVYVSGDSVAHESITWWPVIAPDGSIGWIDGSRLRGKP